MRTILFTLLVAFIPLISYSQANSESLFAQADEHEIVIYPNPAVGDFIHIKGENIQSVEIMNIIGQKIYTKKLKDHHTEELDIAVDDYEKGLYLVKITLPDKQVAIQKILVK